MNRRTRVPLNDQGYSKWNTSGGSNTQDKVFLLGCVEANKHAITYNDSNTGTRMAPTAYAIAQGAWRPSNRNKTADGQSAGLWWLRSPGSDQNAEAYVGTDGSLANTSYVHYAQDSVRPSLWVNLASGIF